MKVKTGVVVMKKVKLFCLPYAGASASVYLKWKTRLDRKIELIPLELAGRGRRHREPFYESAEDAIEDILKYFLDYLDESPFAILGHSMGSILAYELAQKVRLIRGREPVWMFVSGRYPPHIKKQQKIIHNLPIDEFKNEILKLGGTPLEVFENPILTDLFLPVLKADYKLIETYEYVCTNKKLNCGITVFNGKDDCITAGTDMKEWGLQTTNICKVYEFEGDHFFINCHDREITDVINSTLTDELLENQGYPEVENTYVI